jgi:hypothetical protein
VLRIRSSLVQTFLHLSGKRFIGVKESLQVSRIRDFITPLFSGVDSQCFGEIGIPLSYEAFLDAFELLGTTRGWIGCASAAGGCFLEPTAGACERDEGGTWCRFGAGGWGVAIVKM